MKEQTERSYTSAVQSKLSSKSNREKAFSLPVSNKGCRMMIQRRSLPPLNEEKGLCCLKVKLQFDRCFGDTTTVSFQLHPT